MRTRWTVTVDCRDPQRLARFWAVALGYVDRPPPKGWASWEEFLAELGVPEEEWGDGAALCDPEGRLPHLSFLRVPEPKSAKNRLHLDLHVSGGRHLDQQLREERIEAAVGRLVAAGATVLLRDTPDGRLDHVVLADPEGNELCVV